MPLTLSERANSCLWQRIVSLHEPQNSSGEIPEHVELVVGKRAYLYVQPHCRSRWVLLRSSGEVWWDKGGDGGVRGVCMVAAGPRIEGASFGERGNLAEGRVRWGAWWGYMRVILGELMRGRFKARVEVQGAVRDAWRSAWCSGKRRTETQRDAMRVTGERGERGE